MNAAAATRLSHLVDPTTASERVTLPLAHGRRLTVEPEADGERLEVRSPTGALEIAIAFSERGARLVIEAAELSLVAARSLTLDAGEIALRSRGELTLASGADMHVHVAGSRHSNVHGADRTEAHTIETQANEGDVVLRARTDIRVDAEHIGLNDDPCPAPLDWTRAAAELREEG